MIFVARWAIIPAILSKILQIEPSMQGAEDSAVEVKLLAMVTEFVRHALQYQQEQHAMALQAGEQWASFSLELIDNLRKCLKVIMVSLMQKTQLKRALRARLERAEAVNSIIEVGSRVAEEVHLKARDDWLAVRESFLAMLGAE
jgi:hypothetical protein